MRESSALSAEQMRFDLLELFPAGDRIDFFRFCFDFLDVS